MRFKNLGQGFVPKNLGEVKNRDLSFPFSPVKLSSGVVYGKVVSKSIATAEMVYFHDRHEVLTDVSSKINRIENLKLCCPDSISLGK